MNGIIAGISKSTNYTSHTSGTVWAASILDGLMQNNWDNNNGDMPTEIFMGSILRKNTDTFTQKTNVVVNAQMPELVKTVSTYTTAFATLRVHTHRYIQQSTDATGRILALNPDKLKIAVLKAPYIDTGLARSGDYDNRAVVGKFTLEIHNQDANFYADGFLKS